MRNRLLDLENDLQRAKRRVTLARAAAVQGRPVIPSPFSVSLSLDTNANERAFSPFDTTRFDGSFFLHVNVDGTGSPRFPLSLQATATEWSKLQFDVGKSSISSFPSPELVRVDALFPGLTDITVRALDSGGAQVASASTKLSVPYFVAIRESTFGGFLYKLGLDDPTTRAAILAEARRTASGIVASANVRLVWEDPLGSDHLPTHFPFTLPAPKGSGPEVTFVTLLLQDESTTKADLLTADWAEKHPKWDIYFSGWLVNQGEPETCAMLQKINKRDRKNSAAELASSDVIARFIGYIVARTALDVIVPKSVTRDGLLGKVTPKAMGVPDWKPSDLPPFASTFSGPTLPGPKVQKWIDQHLPVPSAFK